MSDSSVFKLYFDPLKAEFSLLRIPAVEIQAKNRHYVINDFVDSIISTGETMRLFSPLIVDGSLEIDGKFEEIASEEASLVNETIPNDVLLAIPSFHQVQSVTEYLILDGFLEIDGEYIEI